MECRGFGKQEFLRRDLEYAKSHLNLATGLWRVARNNGFTNNSDGACTGAWTITELTIVRYWSSAIVGYLQRDICAVEAHTFWESVKRRSLIIFVGWSTDADLCLRLSFLHFGIVCLTPVAVGWRITHRMRIRLWMMSCNGWRI